MAVPSQHPLQLHAAGEDDRDFLLQLYATTRWDELGPTGWSDAAKLDFLRQQFRCQDLHYRKAFPNAAFDVVSIAEPVGRLYLNRGSRDYHVIDVSLLPQWRNRGIGSQLLQQVQAQARAHDCRVSLYVDLHSPARKLYERLGFSAVEPGDIRVRMEC
jgi:ribosomal protein S18 acetylase RimI-like enzyme